MRQNSTSLIPPKSISLVDAERGRGKEGAASGFNVQRRYSIKWRKAKLTGAAVQCSGEREREREQNEHLMKREEGRKEGIAEMAEAIEAGGAGGVSWLFDHAPLARPPHPNPNGRVARLFFEWGSTFGDDRWPLQSSWQIRYRTKH